MRYIAFILRSLAESIKIFRRCGPVKEMSRRALNSERSMGYSPSILISHPPAVIRAITVLLSALSAISLLCDPLDCGLRY